MAVAPELLAGVSLFSDVEPATLEPIARRLQVRDLPAECTLIRQGQDATSFAVVIEGELSVTRDEGSGPEEVAVVGDGSIVGELALLRNRRRGATVTTRTPSSVVTGDREALVALLHLPPVRERLQDVVSLRLAEDAAPVAVRAADGTEYTLRPLVPADRTQLEAGIAAMSDTSLYQRFFTGGRPGQVIVDHLLDVDYLDHFAWVLGDADAEEGLAVARYHRMAEAREVAEVAFAVVDDLQGRGIGTLLLGALATAAAAARIERFRAEVLADNRPMRAVLEKAGAEWSSVEPGVVQTEFDVAAARDLLDAATVARLETAVREIVTAAGLALAHRVT